MPDVADDAVFIQPDPDRFDVTEVEYYHLLRRMAATLTVWNARDLNVPSSPKKLNIPDLSASFQASDMGCCLVVSSVNLIDPARTDGHALEAAHVLVYHAIQNKGWDKVELTGLDTMVNRAAVTAILMDKSVLRYNITEKFKKIIEATREAKPSWLLSQAAPRQGAGGQ